MTAPEQQGSSALFSRENILSLYLPSVILALGQGIALPALPLYAKTFGVSFGVASAVLVVNSVGSLLAGVPTGFLIDRIGRRKIILIGPIISALSAFLIAFASSTFTELLIYRLIGGIGQQMWMIGRITTIADTGGDRQRGRMVTTMSATMNLGNILGPLVGGVITDLLDIRGPFIVYGVLCLLAVLPSFKLIRETSPTDARWGGRRRAAGGSRTDWAWLMVLPILMFFAAQFFASVTRGSLFNGSLNLYAAYTYNAGGTQIGALASSAAVVGIPITIASGAVMDRYGRKATIVPGFTLLALALGVMAATAQFNLPFEVFLVVFVLVNGAMTITSGNMQTLASDIAPPDARGRFFGLLTTMNQGGGVLSPTIFAVLTDNISATAGFLFLAATSAVVAIIVGTQVHDPVRDQRARDRAARQAAAEPSGVAH